MEENAPIEIRKQAFPYVSRGGVKLERALQVLGVDVKDKICLDGGASTGGFTHCLLLHGARRVIAVDVGYGQLDVLLRKNPKVEVWERVNLRYPPAELVKKWEGQIALLTLDVSFISIGKLLTPLKVFLNPSSLLLALLKPQFEAPREKVKKGVVKDPLVHQEVIRKVLSSVREQGYFPRALTFSPLRGPKGNLEFFLLMACQEPTNEIPVQEVVQQAHQEFFSQKVAI